MGKRKKEDRSTPLSNDDKNETDTTNSNSHNAAKIKVTRPPVLLPTKKTKNHCSSVVVPSYQFPAERSIYFDPGIDYANLDLFRAVLNHWHCLGFITFPPFALEVCSLFIRCLNTTRNTNCSDVDNLQNSNGTHVLCSDTRPYLCGTIATLGWIYAFGYKNLVNRRSQIQSLGSLFFDNRHIFDLSMEIVQLLLAVAHKTFALTCSEILNVQIGEWLDVMLDKVSSGGVYRKKVSGGLYLPLYIVLRAIHPKCPEINQVPSSDLSLSDMAYIYLLEPNLYTGMMGEINIFPPALEDGKNYNLWYFYDSLQPQPF